MTSSSSLSLPIKEDEESLSKVSSESDEIDSSEDGCGITIFDSSCVHFLFFDVLRFLVGNSFFVRVSISSAYLLVIWIPKKKMYGHVQYLERGIGGGGCL